MFVMCNVFRVSFANARKLYLNCVGTENNSA